MFAARLKKLASLPILGLIVLAAPLQAIAQTPGAPAAPSPTPSPESYWPGPAHMMWGGGYWNGGYGGPFWEMFPMLIVLVILICILIFYFARTPGGPHPGAPWGDPSHSALQILNERFAKGEIQKEEYEDRKATILAGRRS